MPLLGPRAPSAVIQAPGPLPGTAPVASHEAAIAGEQPKLDRIPQKDVPLTSGRPGSNPTKRNETKRNETRGGSWPMYWLRRRCRPDSTLDQQSDYHERWWASRHKSERPSCCSSPHLGNSQSVLHSAILGRRRSSSVLEFDLRCAAPSCIRHNFSIFRQGESLKVMPAVRAGRVVQ